MKRIDVKDFVSEGYLQEANRLFFHPLGLALEVEMDESGQMVGLGGVWDYRDDPEGVLFGDDYMCSLESHSKASNVESQRKRLEAHRNNILGGVNIQPLAKEEEFREIVDV